MGSFWRLSIWKDAIITDLQATSCLIWWMSIGKYRLLLLLLLRKRILILPYYFNILFASNADNTVNTIPNIATSHIVAFWVSENKGSVIPMTNPAKESLDKSKKYPASLSRLVLSFSFRSCFTACCSLQFPRVISLKGSRWYVAGSLWRRTGVRWWWGLVLLIVLVMKFQSILICLYSLP